MRTFEGPEYLLYQDEEKRIFKEPIGPVGNNNAGPLFESLFLESARLSIYSDDPTLLKTHNAKIRSELYAAYFDGEIRIPWNYDAADVQEMLDLYMAQQIEERRAAIESGIDRSVFDAQKAALALEATFTAKHREQERLLRAELQAIKLSRFETISFLETILTPDMLEIVRIKMGLPQRSRIPVPPTENIPPDSIDPLSESTDESFRELTQGLGARQRMLQTTGLIQPPDTREVAHVSETQHAA